MDMNNIREDNLKRLLEERFDNLQKALADQLGIAESLLSRYLRGRENITDKRAREFEERLSLDTGHLDIPPNSVVTAYTLVKSRTYPLSLLVNLHKYPFIREVSIIYGSEWDLFVKSELPEQHLQHLLMDVLGSHSQIVKNTHTFVAMRDYHWQRKQSEKLLPDNISEKIRSEEQPQLINIKQVDILASKIPQPMKSHFTKLIGKVQQEIDDVLQGTIYIHTCADMLNWLQEAIENVQHSIDISYLYDKNRNSVCTSVFKLECSNLASVVHRNKIKLRTLLILPDTLQIEEDQTLLIMILEQQKLGINVRWIYEKEWISNPLTESPTDFSIWDKESIYIRQVPKTELEWKSDVLHVNRKLASDYTRLFTALFNSGKKLTSGK